MREVVSNTSPLLYLHQLGKLDLLPALYSNVLVPTSVLEELMAGRASGHDIPTVQALPWVEVVSSPTLALLRLAADLGKGECEAIAVAHERNALLILDDALARRHAALLSVRLTGTLGVLLKATNDGLIPPKRLIGDRAYDSDKLDAELKKLGIETISPHNPTRKRKTQDRRALRRYKLRESSHADALAAAPSGQARLRS